LNEHFYSKSSKYLETETYQVQSDKHLQEEAGATAMSQTPEAYEDKTISEHSVIEIHQGS
jgi:hypothetical protein